MVIWKNQTHTNCSFNHGRGNHGRGKHAYHRISIVDSTVVWQKCGAAAAKNIKNSWMQQSWIRCLRCQDIQNNSSASEESGMKVAETAAFNSGKQFGWTTMCSK